MRRIMVIGHGAIGSAVIGGLAAGGYHIGVYVRPGSARAAQIPEDTVRAADMPSLLSFSPDLVIEAAGHKAVAELAPSCLAAGLPVLVTSIGALHDDALYDRLVASACHGNTRLIVPSGAIAGLDYARAVRSAPDLSIHYTSTKPPAAWRDELAKRGLNPEALQTPLALFDGDARQAAGLYPQNLNVAAALALAGAGFERTRVSIVCDPEASGNTHRIETNSALGWMRLEMSNHPSPENPKTSAIVSQSILAAVEQFFSPVQFL